MRFFRLLLVWMLLLAGMVSVSYAQEPELTPFPAAEYDAAKVAAIKLEDVPVLPELTEHARQIYERGQAAGQNANTFAKVGDCMTDADYFLFPFGMNEYELGDYVDLEPLIEYFMQGNTRPENEDPLNPFATNSIAAESGYNTASILDPIWSDPTFCTSDESPLACEYRLSRPAFALIMVGTNDVQFFDGASFDMYTRQIVQETINNNIVPVLYTFPVRPEFPENTVLFNQILINIAQDYDLPLINLHLALKALPDEGIDVPHPTHVSLPADGKAGIFDDEHLQSGAALRNLLTLQTLQIFQDALAEDGGDTTATPASGG